MKEDTPLPDADLMSKLHKLHAETISTLQSNLDVLSTTPTDEDREALLFSCSVALSTLKLLQRQISLRVEDHHATTAKDERTKAEACSLMLQNLNYERDYLRREIETLRGWSAEDLEKLCGDELGLDLNAMDGTNENNRKEGVVGDDVQMDDANKINNPEEAIDHYFFGGEQKSHRDPTNHEAILARLQQDKETRSSLVNELSNSKSELKELQGKKEELRNFLVQIPKKLEEMEKIGESLSGFFKGCKAEWLCNDGSADAGQKLEAANTLVCPPSLKRTDRFRLAQSKLASPLYVLFVQLAGYIDAWSMVDHLNEQEKREINLGGFIGADGMKIVAVPSSCSEEEGDAIWNVEFTLSTVNILPDEIVTLLGRTSKAGIDSIKIVFSYDKVQGVVMAQIANEKNDTNDDLLDNLFPGDDGLPSPNVPSALLKEDNKAELDSTDTMQDSDMMQCNVNNTAKPYRWCQVLSGLNFPTQHKDTFFEVNVCTKAVFRQLLRRIRARESLTALLDFLGRRCQNLPIHPAFRTEENVTSSQIKAKVVSWTEEKDNQSTTKNFVATIKRKSASLKATVTIDMNHYPAEPPVWKLQNEDFTAGSSSWGEQHGDLALLQNSKGGNKAPPLFDATLERIENHVNTDLDQFVKQEVESTYDWLLIHQLVEIVSCWDEIMSANEGNGGKGGNITFGSRRVRKGKDRRLVSFGEQSLFSYYRHGF